jgi:hypothetical protein
MGLGSQGSKEVANLQVEATFFLECTMLGYEKTIHSMPLFLKVHQFWYIRII